MAQSPVYNDNDYSLMLKAAWNTYDIAIAHGAGGLTPPKNTDGMVDLMKKIATYTAMVIDTN